MNASWSIAAFGVLCLAKLATADVYLVGAQLYSAESSGANSSIFGRYEFCTNINTGHYPFPFEPGGGTSVAVPLAAGNNLFSFSTVGLPAMPLGEWAGLNLFFDTALQPFNPPPSNGPVAGHLTVSTHADGTDTSFFVPTAGTLVQCYSGPPYAAAANGLTIWPSSEYRMRVTQFAVQRVPGPENFLTGTFAVRVEGMPTCPADFNNNGLLSVQDLFDFLASYFAGEFRADFNHSATLTVQDIFDFLAAYFAGCP